MKRRILKLSLWLGAALFAWLLTTGIVIWNFGSNDYSKPSDCIIILGAAA